MGELSKATNALLASGARRATVFLSPKETLVIARRRFGKNKRFDRHAIDLVVTVGRPNYANRQHIKLLRRAEEPFPVRRVRLEF